MLTEKKNNFLKNTLSVIYRRRMCSENVFHFHSVPCFWDASCKNVQVFLWVLFAVVHMQCLTHFCSPSFLWIFRKDPFHIIYGKHYRLKSLRVNTLNGPQTDFLKTQLCSDLYSNYTLNHLILMIISTNSGLSCANQRSPLL